jgi:hypothetical protein
MPISIFREKRVVTRKRYKHWKEEAIETIESMETEECK